MPAPPRSAAAPLSAAYIAALVLLAVTVRRGWVVTYLWLLTLPLFGVVLLIAVAVFVFAVWGASRDGRRWPLPVAVALAFAGIAGSVVFVVSPQATAWTRFWYERPAFAAVTGMDAPEHGRGDHYGAPLPSYLCFVSVNCKVAVIGTSKGYPVRFVPDHLGIPDGAAGYGHFTGSPDPGPYDGFGDDICPTLELGGGWWWLGPCPESVGSGTSAGR